MQIVALVSPAGALEIPLRLHGPGAALDALAAVAVAVALGRDLKGVAGRLATVSPLSRRLQLRLAPSGLAVLDDSYNANPRSVAVALEALAEMSTSGARAVVLGDMLELGDAEHEAHEAVGRALAGAGLRFAVLVGPRMAIAAAEAVRAGFSASDVFACAAASDALEVVRAHAAPGDVVLVKGSRSMRLDRVADALVGES